MLGNLTFKGASDALSHPSLETALQRCGVQEGYILAIMREIYDSKVSFKFLDIASDPVLLAQGDPASPPPALDGHSGQTTYSVH